MSDYNREKEELVEELEALKKRIRELEARDRTEPGAAKSEGDYLDDVLRNIGVGFIALDREMRIRYFNKEAEGLLGVRAEDVLGRLMFDEAFPEAKGSLFDRKYTEALRELQAITFEAYFDREPYRNWYEAAVYPWRDGIAIYFEVTTERKRAEGQLRVFKNIADTAPYGVYITDLEGRISYINESGARMHGYAADELVGEMAEALHSPDMSEEARKALGAPPERRSFTGLEVARRRKDGSSFPASMNCSPILAETGEPVKLAHTAVDIADRKSLEHELLQSQKMEVVGLLAGGVAHDFNNILSPILSYSDFYLTRLEPGHELFDGLREIRNSALRARDLTRQLLAFSRKQKLEARVLNLCDLVENLRKMLRRLIGEDIELVTDMPEEKVYISADPVRVEQVLMNLAINARDAMPEGGRLLISVREIDLDEVTARAYPGIEPGPHAVIKVHDCGEGMEAAVAERVFEPFFTTKGRERGTGLGLSTAYGIVKQHRGHIGVSSSPGRGATFTIHLPRYQSAPDEDELVACALPAPGNSERIMIVEDEESVRKIASVILASHGYKVMAAEHPEEAFTLLRKETGPIDLLLTDVVMPGMNGPELHQRLLSRQPGLKVLFMSGYIDQQMDIPPETKLKDGNFLEKPFSTHTLLEKVRGALKNA